MEKFAETLNTIILIYESKDASISSIAYTSKAKVSDVFIYLASQSKQNNVLSGSKFQEL